MSGEIARLEVTYPAFPITAQVTAFGRGVTAKSVKSAISEAVKDISKSQVVTTIGNFPAQRPFDCSPCYMIGKPGEQSAVLILIMGDTADVVTVKYIIKVEGNKKFDWNDYFKFAKSNCNTLLQMLQQETQMFYQQNLTLFK